MSFRTAVVSEIVSRLSAHSWTTLTPSSVTADFAVVKDEDPVLREPELYAWISTVAYDRIARCKFSTDFVCCIGVRCFCKNSDNARLIELMDFTQELAELAQTWDKVLDYSLIGVGEDEPFDIDVFTDSNQFQFVLMLTLKD